MNPCPDNLRLQAYHDGELSPAETVSLAGHLASCPRCTAELMALRAGSDLLAGAPLPMPPAGLSMRVRRHIERRSERAFWRLAWSLTAAAMLLLATALHWQWNSAGTTDSTDARLWEADRALALSDSAAAVSEESRLAQWMFNDLAGYPAPGSSGATQGNMR